MNSLRAAVCNGAWLVLMLIVGTLCLNPHGCRSMSNIVFERRNPYGIEYHAKDEELLASGQPVPSLLWGGVEMSRQHSATLSQPIAITSWRGDSPTWEIFFATNRDIIGATEGSSQERFGNSELTESPRYGRAAITLPFRRRGEDPQREEPRGSAGVPQSVVTFEEVRSLPWETMAAGVKNQIARSRQHDVLLFVHGFNVDFESALIRTAQLGLDIPFNGAVVAYCWPSQGGVPNYLKDGPFNARSVRPFTEFLQRLVVAVPEDTRINIIVHSMGNRIVMQAVSELPQLNNKPIANLVLCAPDVGVSNFKRWAPGVVAQCEQVTLYASRSDSALIASKGINDEQRVGDIHPPICLPEIDTIDVSAVDFDLILGHSYYGSNRNVLSDLFFVVKEQRPAAERKYLSRIPVGVADGHYWQFCDEAPYIRCSWVFGESVTR